MKIRRIDHVGIVVHDLAAATAFFVDLGFEVRGETEMEGEWLDRIVGLSRVKTALVFLRTQEGDAGLELVRFYRPEDRNRIQKPSANMPGIRHVAFVVDDIDAVVDALKKKGTEIIGEVTNYENVHKLCYIRGPENIIVELAQEIG